VPGLAQFPAPPGVPYYQLYLQSQVLTLQVELDNYILLQETGRAPIQGAW
jgi:hypothetical protein